MKKILVNPVLALIAIVGSVAFIFGAIQFYGHIYGNKPSIAWYQEDVDLNAANDGRFVKFLEENTDKMVFINSEFDASVSTSSQQQIIEQCLLDHEQIDGGGYISIPSFSDDGSIWCGDAISFELKPAERLQTSHGGVGLYYIKVTDFFQVGQHVESGPMRVFSLKQYNAPIELRAEYLHLTASQ